MSKKCECGNWDDDCHCPVTFGQALALQSGGGSSDYYKIPEHATDLMHLMSHVGMSKARGDIFKACYRVGAKEGASVKYDIDKIRFFADELEQMYLRGEHI
tara:strand:- start:19 stop:321 length:303 start_codon:yes stop_codon:yes gene_type:complete